MPDLYTHTPEMLDYTPGMLIVFRLTARDRIGMVDIGPRTGNTIPVRIGGRVHTVAKADIVRVGKRTFASSVEVDDVVLYEDGMTQEVTGVDPDGDGVALTFDGGGVGGDNVGRFDSSDYSLFVVVADTEA